MDEQLLLRCAIGCLIVGTCLLFVLGAITKVPVTSVPLDELELEEFLVIEGKVTSVKLTKNVLLLTIQRLEDISTVAFLADGPPALVEGDFVKIQGTVKEYNGKREFQAQNIELIYSKNSTAPS